MTWKVYVRTRSGYCFAEETLVQNVDTGHHRHALKQAFHKLDQERTNDMEPHAARNDNSIHHY